MHNSISIKNPLLGRDVIIDLALLRSGDSRALRVCHTKKGGHVPPFCIGISEQPLISGGFATCSGIGIPDVMAGRGLLGHIGPQNSDTEIEKAIAPYLASLSASLNLFNFHYPTGIHHFDYITCRASTILAVALTRLGVLGKATCHSLQPMDAVVVTPTEARVVGQRDVPNDSHVRQFMKLVL